MRVDKIFLTPSVALADLARKMNDKGLPVIQLQTGDPDFETHPEIIQATYQSLLDGDTHYSYMAGLPNLRFEISRRLNNEFRLSLTQENILVSHGAAQGIAAVIGSIICEGDEAIVLEPNWSTIDSQILIAGGNPIKISFLLSDSDLIESLNQSYTKKTKIICINSPNNPTGVVFSDERIALIINWAREKGIYVLSDEVYRYHVYDVKHASVLNYFSYEKIIFVDSFSKKYAMTGWRLGYVVANPILISKIVKYSQVNITNIAPFIQRGGVKAITSSEVAEHAKMMLSEYKFRRLSLIRLCNELNLEFIKPEGAFYLFIKVTPDDMSFAKRLLDDYLVSVVPGSAYGVSGSGWIRVTYSRNLNLVESGLRKISELLLRLK